MYTIISRKNSIHEYMSNVQYEHINSSSKWQYLEEKSIMRVPGEKRKNNLKETKLYKNYTHFCYNKNHIGD